MRWCWLLLLLSNCAGQPATGLDTDGTRNVNILVSFPFAHTCLTNENTIMRGERKPTSIAKPCPTTSSRRRR